MSYLKLRVCIGIVGIFLEVFDLHATVAIKKDFKGRNDHNYLWNTKNMLAVNVSPDAKHILISYLAPTRSSNEDRPEEFSTDDIKSTWKAIALIKNNYKQSTSSKERIYNQDSLDVSSWAPDSQKISYLSQGNKNVSLWVTSTQKFKPEKILELEESIVGYQWSPDGKKIAVLARQKISPKAIKVVADVDSFSLTNLYVLDINEKLEVSNLTPLLSSTVLSDIYKANYSKSLSWSPDSQYVAYSYCPLSSGKLTNFVQIDIINVITKKIKTLAKGEGTNIFPFMSPNGKYLAYVTNILPENTNHPIRVFGANASRVCVIRLSDSHKYCLANTLNENPTLIGWKKDGKSLFAVDQEGLRTHIYELKLDGKSIDKFTTGEQIIEEAQVNASGAYIGYAVKSFKTPAEVYVTSTDTFKPKKITSFSDAPTNDDIVVEAIQWKAQDQQFDLEGVFMYPKKGEWPFPLITLLNDYLVTAASLGYIGDFTPYPLSLLSLLEKGYAIFIPDRRGTNGYGVKFRQAIYKELGGEEFQDVLSGIDKLIEKKKADPQKLALWGWGYGGYLSALTLIQTDRFKTIIVGAGIANLISHLGTTVDPSLVEALMGGFFWRDWKTWREKSPISHVKNMKIPTFIQTGQKDEIVNPSQSEELFFPLKTNNRPVQMITYRNQGHTFYEPHVIVMGIKDLEVWLEKYFSPPTKAKEQKGK